MNNLYEFGGSCDVVIRCNSERTINNKQYKAGEPYTILRDVFCSLQYKNNTAEANAKTNIVATRQGSPDIVNISNIVLNDKICDLIATRNGFKYITKVYEGYGENGKLYLPQKPEGSIFIFKGSIAINEFEINDYILTGNFEEGASYLVIYQILTQHSCFEFDTPHYGYFSLEIIGKGNQNKKSENIYMSFPAVSLMSVPVFDLVNGTLLNTPLQFECIHHRQNKAYFNIGE